MNEGYARSQVVSGAVEETATVRARATEIGRTKGIARPETPSSKLEELQSVLSFLHSWRGGVGVVEKG